MNKVTVCARGLKVASLENTKTTVIVLIDLGDNITGTMYIFENTQCSQKKLVPVANSTMVRSDIYTDVPRLLKPFEAHDTHLITGVLADQNESPRIAESVGQPGRMCGTINNVSTLEHGPRDRVVAPREEIVRIVKSGLANVHACATSSL